MRASCQERFSNLGLLNSERNPRDEMFGRVRRDYSSCSSVSRVKVIALCGWSFNFPQYFAQTCQRGNEIARFISQYGKSNLRGVTWRSASDVPGYLQWVGCDFDCVLLAPAGMLTCATENKAILEIERQTDLLRRSVYS